MTQTLKKINFNEGKFEANGRMYYIQADSLSIERYIKYEEFAYNVALDQSLEQVANTFTKIYEACTTGDSALQALHKSATLAYNQLKSIKEFSEKREPAVLWFDTLFINRANEDLKDWDPNLAAEKIADWKAEGLDMHPFFLFATNAIRGFNQIYRWVDENDPPAEVVSKPKT